MVTTVKYFVITVTFDQLNASMLNKSVFVCVLLICILNEIGIGVHKQVLDFLVEINENSQSALETNLAIVMLMLKQYRNVFLA